MLSERLADLKEAQAVQSVFAEFVNNPLDDCLNRAHAKLFWLDRVLHLHNRVGRIRTLNNSQMVFTNRISGTHDFGYQEQRAEPMTRLNHHSGVPKII